MPSLRPHYLPLQHQAHHQTTDQPKSNFSMNARDTQLQRSRWSVSPELCPECGSAESRIVWNGSNAVRVAYIGLIRFIEAVLLILTHGRRLADFSHDVRLSRRCQQCQHEFIPAIHPPMSPFCIKCGYDLTGNESGMCPECGSKISRRAREQLRKAARNLTTHS